MPPIMAQTCMDIQYSGGNVTELHAASMIVPSLLLELEAS
jgi:hypothetical protein